MNTAIEAVSGRHIVIHTDGACIGNPGPGGWAAILQSMDGTTERYRRAIAGAERDTTNNRMEMLAAIEGLQMLKSNNPVIVRSDSQYLVKGMTEWLEGWKRKGWRTAAGKQVANVQLWEQLDSLNSARSISWEWVRGHSGDPLNEEADRLAHMKAKSIA